MPPRFEQFEHTADVGIHVYGATLNELFENAAFGMSSLIAELDTVASDREQEIALTSQSIDSLLVEWLRELLFRHEVYDLIFTEFSVKAVSREALAATAKAGPLLRDKTQTLRQIKAVTYHELEIHETEEGWRAKIIFDV